jgi:DNA-3-methyladenine glycosylase
MYETYGFVYVYLIYGMHYCLNFTTDKEKAGAVLIR